MAKRYPYTAKTMQFFRDAGYDVGVVERFVMYPKPTRIDLFGIIDIIAMGNGNIIGIQSTSWNQRKPHIETIVNSPNSQKWIEAGGDLFLCCWKKQKIKRGGKAFKYVMVTERYCGVGQFEPVLLLKNNEEEA